jgi:hypothetical protein
VATSERWRPKLRRELVERRAGDELLIYDLSNDQVSCLDANAASVWELTDGTRTIPELAAAIGQPGEAGEMIVSHALDLFAAEGLLDADGLVSRRAALGRSALVAAGVAAAAIPTVKAAIAPSRARAFRPPISR